MLFRIALCLAVLCGVASAQQITSLPPVVTTSLAATLVVKAAPGTLYSVYATNLTGGTSGYLVLYNATAAPTPGALTGALVLDCVPFNSLGEAIVSYQGYPAKTFCCGSRGPWARSRGRWSRALAPGIRVLCGGTGSASARVADAAGRSRLLGAGLVGAEVR